MKRGFTLLELVVVIIIISIMVTLGLIQYNKVMEKGRSAEARSNLGLLRKLQSVYYTEKDKYGITGDLIGAGLPISETLPYGNTACDSAINANHYFRYRCYTSGYCYATRCTSGGKEPQAKSNYWIWLSPDGTWGGTTGYY